MEKCHLCKLKLLNICMTCYNAIYLIGEGEQDSRLLTASFLQRLKNFFSICSFYCHLSSVV